MRRAKLTRDFAFYFAEKGRIVPWREMLADSERPQRVRRIYIIRLYRSYDNLIKDVKRSHPEMLTFLNEPQSVPTKDPLRALRASTTEKTYE